MTDQITSKLHKERNRVLIQYADHSFASALDEINESLKSEKNHGKNNDGIDSNINLDLLFIIVD